MSCGPCRSIIGFSFNVDAGASLGAVEAAASAAVGGATDAYAKAEEQLGAALAVGEGVADAKEAVDQAGNDVGAAIVAVASHPLTHAALGALAVSAPPFTTIAAAVGEAALGIAVGAVELVKAAEDVWNDVFMSYTAKAAREWGVSESEAQRILDWKAKRKDIQANYKANEAKAAEQLGTLRDAAAHGDPEAMRAVAALDAMMRTDVLMLVTALRFGCAPEVYAVDAETEGGHTPGNLCDAARVLVADYERAAGMSESEFAHYSKLGRGTVTDAKGRTTGYRFEPVNKGGKQVMQIIDAATGKVVREGDAAVREWRLGLHPLIDRTTRQINLGEAIRAEYQAAFKQSLAENWKHLDELSRGVAKKLERARVAKQKAFEESEERRLAVLKGHQAVEGTLVTADGAMSVGRFRINKSSKLPAGFLVRADGYVHKAKWVAV